MSLVRAWSLDAEPVRKFNMDTYDMRVFRNGKLIRTIPISTGEQPKFTTRSGTKVASRSTGRTG